MTGHAGRLSTDLSCHRCGHDLRAQAPGGGCPECGEPVAESRRVAAIPRRPDWRDSDPRWRRRVLAGAWVLVLVPLADVVRGLGWASRVPAPALLFTSHDPARSLDETLICHPGVYRPLVFCIGLVLLFADERARRRSRLDWTRRWGVLCSYPVLLLSAASFFTVAALVLAGMAALFHSMPVNYQPRARELLVDVSTCYLRYGPQPMYAAAAAHVTFSSVAVLLACVPLFDALRSSRSKWVAAVALAPLALFSLMHLAQVARYCLDASGWTSGDVLDHGAYFRPQLVASLIVDRADRSGLVPVFGAVVVEAAKWCAVLAIAVWLTIARLAAWRRRETVTVAQNPPL